MNTHIYSAIPPPFLGNIAPLTYTNSAQKLSARVQQAPKDLMLAWYS